MRNASLVAFALVLMPVALPAAAGEKAKALGEAHESDICVNVDVNGSSLQDYSCVNALLKKKITISRQSSQAPVTNSTSPSNRLGLFNLSALQMKMGGNLGSSVQPYRPAPVQYQNGIAR